MGRKKSEKIILPPELRRRYLTTKSKSPTRTYSSSNTIAITLSDFPASTPNLSPSMLLKEKEESGVQIDPVVALPVKTLDGKLYYRTLTKTSTLSELERREKLKKQRKEAKKLGKELEKVEEVQQTPQAAVMAELKEDLTAEEAFEILSMLAVFKDIIPGYRIRLPTEKELEMKVSKDVKNMRFNESTLLSAQGIPAVVDNFHTLTSRRSWKLCCATAKSLLLLWNEKDADGNTVLHHHSNSSKLIPQVMNDLRLDKMAFNKQNLDAFDVALTSEETGIGKITFANYCQSKHVFRRVVKVEGKNMIVKKYDIIEEKFMSKVGKAAKAHLVVAALIATACDLCSSYDRAWRFCIWPRC
nr:hypothetical protein CFP56_05870 [Quercus suber]